MSLGSITIACDSEFEILGLKNMTFNVGETRATLTMTIVDSDGSDIDLKPGTDWIIKFHQSLEGAASLAVDEACTISGTSPTNIFTYQISSSASTNEGVYLCRFKLTDDSTKVTFSKPFTITYTARMPSS